MFSCCKWILIAVGSFVCEINPKAGWIWGSTTNRMCKLLCWHWWNEAEFTSAGFGACQHLVICCLCSLLDPSLFLCETGQWVLLILGLFRETLVEAYDKSCLWPVLNNLFGTICNRRPVTPFSKLGWMQKPPSCTPRPVFTRFWSRGRSAKVSEHREISLHLQIFCRVSESLKELLVVALNRA